MYTEMLAVYLALYQLVKQFIKQLALLFWADTGHAYLVIVEHASMAHR